MAKARKASQAQAPAVISTELLPLSSAGTDDNTYRQFIENLPVMFYAVSPEPPHTPLYISPTFTNFGYPLDDWMTDPDIWDRVIHPDDREQILDATRAAMRKGNGIDFGYRVVC